jgi:hypothetical protein
MKRTGIRVGWSNLVAWRRPLRTGLGAVTAVAAVFLMAASAAGSPALGVRAGPVVGPPYPGTPYNALEWVELGCSTMKDPVHPFFNLSTGHARASVATTLRACGPANGTSVVLADAAFQSLPFNRSAGVHYLTGHWVLNFAVNLSVHRGNLSQQASAEFQVAVAFSIYDATAGTNIGGTDVMGIVNHTITHGTYVHTYTNVHLATYFNATYNSSHTYIGYVLVQVLEELTVGPGASTASASVNMASGGKSAYLATLSLV